MAAYSPAAYGISARKSARTKRKASAIAVLALVVASYGFAGYTDRQDAENANTGVLIAAR
jgi:hypothetical protein